MPLLEVESLRTALSTEKGWIRPVDGVSFHLEAGKTLGVVGESGCGKSMTALSILKLIPTANGKIEAGRITFDGEDLQDLDDAQMRQIRGRRIAMIFQEPMTALNPVFTIGNQIMEVLKLHKQMDSGQARERAIETLKLVGIPSPELRVQDYPHQLSGGMRQRAMIAMALACEPDLLIADEPTTALDVTIQAQILELLKELQDKFGMAILLISHDLGVIAELAHKVMVMYAGQVVETTTVENLYHQPLHPYTKALYRSLPSVQRSKQRNELEMIPGIVPDLAQLPSGCRFADRCTLAIEACREKAIDLDSATDGHDVRCIRAGE